MALTADQLVIWRDGLIQARMSGVRSFQDQNGESVVYRSDAEMAAAIAAANVAIAAAQAGQPVKSVVFQTSKGLCS